MNGTVIQEFLTVLKQEKILGSICFSKQIFYRKQSLGAPDVSRTVCHNEGYVHTVPESISCRHEKLDTKSLPVFLKRFVMHTEESVKRE